MVPHSIVGVFEGGGVKKLNHATGAVYDLQITEIFDCKMQAGILINSSVKLMLPGEK